MKRFLVLVFAVVVVASIGVSAVFAKGGDYTEATYRGWVVSISYYSKLPKVGLEILEYRVLIQLDVKSRKEAGASRMVTLVPEDSPFVPLLISAYENHIKCEFYVELLHTLDRFDMPINVNLLGVKTLEVPNRPSIPYIM